MEGLAVIDGDLVLSGSNLLTVSGAARIKQDLDIALHDQYGSNPQHPYWGSILDRFVGKPLTPATEQQVVNEVKRVVNNYIAVQSDLVNQAAITNSRGTLSTKDIVTGIVSLDVKVNMDTIRISLVLSTMANESVTLNREVTI